MFSVRDLNTVHRRLLEHLGIEQLHAALGGSLGGMQALQWALDDPQAMTRCAAICASAELSAQNIAFSTVAREAIMRDPGFQGGRYHEQRHGPEHRPRRRADARRTSPTCRRSRSRASSAARAASTDARAPGSGRTSRSSTTSHHQGASFLARFDALTYLYLTRTMDYFTPFEEHGVRERLRGNPTRFLAISFDTDWRFSSAHSAHIARELQAAGCAAEHVERRLTLGTRLVPAGRARVPRGTRALPAVGLSFRRAPST